MNKPLLQWAIALPVFCYVFAAAQVNVVTQHNNRERTGANLEEIFITPANVNKEHFGMLFKHIVIMRSAQPWVLTSVHIGGGWHDVVYATTVNNCVYALDANEPEAKKPFRRVNFGTPASLYDYDSNAWMSTETWESSVRPQGSARPRVGLQVQRRSARSNSLRDTPRKE